MLRTLKFPRGVEVDLRNVPDDFEALIAKAFGEYTNGTRKEYAHHDKLAFIDLMRRYAHDARYVEADSEVNELMKNSFAHTLVECGTIMNESDFLSIEFMEECYQAGFDKGSCNLYHQYETESGSMNDLVLSLLYRAIKVVIEWEG